MLTAVPLIFSSQDWLMLCRRKTRWARGSCGWFCFIFVVIGEGKEGADRRVRGWQWHGKTNWPLHGFSWGGLKKWRGAGARGREERGKGGGTVWRVIFVDFLFSGGLLGSR